MYMCNFSVRSKYNITTGYNQSVTGCGSQRKHVVVTQRKLMLTNTSFPNTTCHLEKNITASRTTGQFIVYFASVSFKLLFVDIICVNN